MEIDSRANAEEGQRFPLRAFSPIIMGGGALFFFLLGMLAAFLSLHLHEGHYGSAVASFVIGSAMAFWLLNLLRMNRHFCRLTVEGIAITYVKRPARHILWREVIDFDVWLIPNQGWRFTLRGSNRTKIEVDASTPEFNAILKIVRFHLAANGKQILIDKVANRLSAQR